MGVVPERHLDVLMAHDVLQRLRVHPGLRHLRAERVTQRMRCHAIGKLHETNANDWALDAEDVIDSSKLDATAGVWFGGTTPDDSKGALPYDTYLIEELRCTANEGYQLIETSVIVSRKDTGEKEVTGHYLRCVGYWNVFNASEIEGIPAPPAPEHVSDRTAAIADDLILSSRCPIVESMRYQGSAGYAPGSDRILIAPRETFLSDETFTRVLLHEMTHSTGHPSALNRGCNTDFGSPEYAQEELVAELGSLFLSADLGIQNTDYEGEHYENHVSYLQSWMHALEDDPSYLFKAAAKADKAGTLIIGRYNDVLEKRRDRDVERAPEKVSLKGEVTAMKDAAKRHDEQAKAPEIAVSAR